jgi:ABC-type multidrug transport system fused ATPase/permease subunit
MLGDMKSVKLLGLTDKMFEIIHHLQWIEVETSKRFRKIFIAQVFFCQCFSLLPCRREIPETNLAYLLTHTQANAPAALAPVLTFALYVGLSHAQDDSSILVSRAFTSLALISLLASSALTFIQSIPAMGQCIACFERIKDYCSQSSSSFSGREHSSTKIKLPLVYSETELRELKATGDSDNLPPVMSFSDQSFAWIKDGPAILKSLNFEIRDKKVTVILGPTASGKSTLLQSLIGETVALEGRTERNFSVAAYCPQVTWLTNGTLKDNIIGASHLDETWYASVLQACGLEDDIPRMPNGDHTKVGNNGINLSGGQRQRVVSSLLSVNLLVLCLPERSLWHVPCTPDADWSCLMTRSVAWTRTPWS